MLGNLGKALVRVRDLLSGGHVDEAVKEAALATVEELSTESDQAIAERLGAWMLLREQRGETPGALRELLFAAAGTEAPEDPSRPPELWRLFGVLTNTRDQERCVGLLVELFPEEGVRRAEVVRHLQHAAPGMVRPLVAELLEAGQAEALGELYVRLLSRPTRNPSLLAQLADHAENERLRVRTEEWPIPVHRLQSLFRLAVHLEQRRIGNPALARAQQRLTTVLTGGAPSVLRRLLADADMALLRSTLHIAERGVDGPLENELIAYIADTAPELFRENEKPFWETGLWTTRAGLERRKAQLRELVDVKLPANSEAIGKAASFGDLSENSEWEAAIEEQRKLTQRAQEIEAEIRSAHILEEVALPPDTVAPGTAVRFRDLASGEMREVKLLGPWDEGDDATVSYRAPLAAGLLGCAPGDRVKIELPSGELDVEVIGVEALQLA
jgi:transcription elongation GreA/GreB family factor